MADAATTVVTDPPNASEPAPAVRDDLVEDDQLVEEVSIDGMCGVY